MKEFHISEEKRKQILGIIAREFEYPTCDNCAHYLGCAGGHRLGPPCSGCSEGPSGYEPDEQTKGANDDMFNQIEEVLNL